MARSAVAEKPILATDAQIPVAPLSMFAIAKENPRTIRPQEAIASLAANLTANGVLTPVICYEEGGKLQITCGGTRFLAAKQAKLDGLPYDRRTKIKAIEAGLVEQEGHTPLHPADQAVAFALEVERFAKKLETAKGGLDAPDDWERSEAILSIARRVGRTERFVAQRLALAELHPPILKALREDRISVKQAEAWANASRDRQEELWKEDRLDYDPQDIKQRIDKADIAENDRLAKFVGEQAYVAAGGAIKQDLFDIERDPWDKSVGGRLDRELVQKLAREKLAEAKKKLEAEGWGEVKTTLAVSHAGYSEKAQPKTKEERAKYRAEISINEKGKLSIVRGLRIKTKEAAEKSGAGPAKAQESYEVREKRRRAHQELIGVAEQIVARAIPSVRGLGLACMAAAVARALLHELGNDELIMLDLNYGGARNVGLATDGDLKTERAYWLKRLKPHASELEAHFLEATGEDVDRLFAFALTGMIQLNEYDAQDPDKQGRKQLLQLARLAEISERDLAAHTTPKVKAIIDSPLLRELIGVPLPANAISAEDICKIHPPAKAKKSRGKT